ncbi:MAG: hypothetical protein LBK82_08010 [Planctomycetaceae bacterium]|nr:hypothetical protein [Planctomycetaceae bacterium]
MLAGNRVQVGYRRRPPIFADSESDGRWQMVLLSVLESMQTLPAQPPSGRIAHLDDCR